MQILGGNSLLLLERAMDGLWTRQTTINNNIAHAETPNYKAKYVTFEDSLKAKVRAAESGATRGEAFRQSLAAVRPQVHQVEESTRMDDNGVNVVGQNVELVRTAYQLQYLMDSINSELTVLRSAIRGQ